MSITLKVLTTALFLSLPLGAQSLERIKLLPPESQIYFHISNTTQFGNKFKQSSVGKLWADPQFQDCIGNPAPEFLLELLFDDKPDAEAQILMDQVKILSGELIIAFDRKMEKPLMVAAISKADFNRSLEMDEKLRQMGADSSEIIKSTFQDVDIIQYVEDGGTVDEESTWQAHLKETLIFGNTREWVEKCIIQLQKNDLKEPAGNPTLSLHIPIAALIQEEILEEMKEAANTSPMATLYDPAALLDALGLLGIERYTLKIELKDTEMVADSHLHISDLSRGLFSLLDIQPSELPRVAFIPENISSLEVGRFNLLRFWQEIPVVLANAAPTIKPQFDMLMTMLQQQIGIDLEQDLLSHIGTQYIAFSEVVGDAQTSVIAVELNDGLAFSSSFESIFSAPIVQSQVAANLTIENFIGHTLYTFQAESGSISFGISGNYLLYGATESLHKLLRSQNNHTAAQTSFEHSKLVQNLRENISRRAFGFGVIDWKKNMESLMHEINKPEYILLMQQNWAKSGSPIPPPDFTKLPTADHMASFFNLSYQYIEATKSGLHQRFILKY